MKRFLLSIMALSLCAVMSFAAISLPYKENFESYGNTVVSSLSSTTGNKGYFQNVKVPAGWIVGNKDYSATDASPVGGATTYTLRGYFPFICTNGTNTAYAESAAATYQYACSGLNSLKLYGYYSTTASSNHAPAYAILPELDDNVDLQKVVISGKAKLSTSASYVVEIGVMSDPTDMKTWTTIGQFGPGNGTTGTSKPVCFEATLKDYAGTGRYLAFRTPEKASVTAYLDDIEVYTAICHSVEPIAETINDTTVTILLDTTMITNESEWKAKVMKGIVSVDDVDQTDGTLYPSLYGRRNTFYYLDPNQDYTIAVSLSCPESPGEYSRWKVVSFKTLYKYLTKGENNVYYETGFEASEGFVKGSAVATKKLPNWEVGNISSGATATYLPYVNSSTTYSQKGDANNNYLYMYTTSTYPYAILPPIAPVDNDWSKVELTFKMTGSTTASYNREVKVCIVDNPIAPAAFPLLTNFTEIATKVIDPAPSSSKEGWKEFTVTFEDYNKLHATGNRIALLLDNNVTAYAYIDDISVHQISECSKPNSLNANVVTNNGCEMEWKGDSVTQYRVKWTNEKITDDTKTTYTNWVGDSIVTGNFATISGLVANQNYWFVVATVCGDDEYSELSEILAIRTLCPDSYAIPYFSDFDSNSATGSGNGADCWEGKQFTTSTTVSDPYVIANRGVSGENGDNSLYLYANMTKLVSKDSATVYAQTYAITPALSGQDLKNCMVRFYMASYSNSTSTNSSYTPAVVVGVTVDNTIESIGQNFIPLDTIIGERNDKTFKQYCKLDLSKYASLIPDEAKYIVLKSDPKCIPALSAEDIGTNTYAYYYSAALIDNFEVTLPPCCMEPSIALGAKTSKSLTVNITPYKSTDNEWQLAAISADLKDTILATATSTNCEITGLKASTVYNIYARTYCSSCGDGEYSNWTLSALNARTKDYYVDSLFFGFEDSEGWEFLPLASATYKKHPALCVGNPNATSNSYIPYQVVGGASVYAKTGTNALRFYSYFSYPGPYTIFPALDECTPEERSIRFNYRQGYHTKTSGAMQYNYTDTIKIQLGLVPKGTTAPSAENFRLLQEFTPQNLTGKICTDSEQYWETMVYNLNKVQVTDSQVCIWWPQTHSSGSWYVYIDDVQITEKAPFEVPVILSVTPTDVTVTAQWEEMTDAVNVYVYNGSVKVAEKLNVAANSATITGLAPTTTYTIKLVDATVPSAPATSMQFTTDNAAMALPAIFTFDDHISKTYPNSTTLADSVYWSPDNWYLGNSSNTTTKYYYWLVQRTGYNYSYSSAPSRSTSYDNYCYGMKDAEGKPTNSLRLSAYSSTSKTPYAVLPRVSGNLNECVLDLYFRPAILNMSTGKLIAVSTEKKFYVVALGDAKNLNTADTVDVIEYKEAISTSTVAADDPDGLEYWRNYILPLKGVSPTARLALVPAGTGNTYFFIDSVQIRMPYEGELFAPIKLNVEDITENSATLSWESANTGDSFLLTVTNTATKEDILSAVPVSELSYQLTDLKANTNYSFNVVSTKGGYFSNPSLATAFNTNCASYTGDSFAFGFEAAENHVLLEGTTTATLVQNRCWVYENLGTSTTKSTSYSAFNQKDAYSSGEKSTFYAHSGDYCLHLYAQRAANAAKPTYMSRVISPEIDAEAIAQGLFDSKVLQIHYRAVYHNKTQVYGTYLANNYSKGMIVGVCSDPNDESTFVTLDTLYYTKNPTTAEMTEEDDFGWMKAFVSLKGVVGNRIWMQAYLKDVSTLVYDKMYVDDISFVEKIPVLTTAVNDNMMGVVSNGDAYAAQTSVTVEATPNYNFEFVKWSDETTENPYTFNMPDQDLTLTAIFAPKQFTVSQLEGESFEDGDDTIRWVRVPGSTIDTYRQLSGWTYGNAGTTKTYISTYWPYNTINTTTVKYSQDGDLSLKMYAKSNGEYLSYVATPKISDMENLAGKQIQFYMRPLYCYTADHTTASYRNKVSTTYATSSHAKGVIVGTCSDPADTATFHPIMSVYYSKDVATTEYATEDNNYLWESFTVPMVNIPEGDSCIYIMATNKDASGNVKSGDGWLYLDSISFGAAKPVIIAIPNNSSMGTVTGGGSYEAGTEITIKATPKYNHHFMQWSDGNQDTVRTFNVEASATYTAIFAVDTFTIGSLETFEEFDGTAQRLQRVPGTSQSDSYRGTCAWTYGNVGSGTAASYYPYNIVNTTSSKYSYDGEYALRLYATGTTYCNYVVTPAIDTAILDNAEFTFYMKPTYTTIGTGKDYTTYYGTSYAKTVIVGVATDPTNTETFVPVDTITYAYDPNTYEDPSIANNNNWQKVSLSLKNNKAPYVYIMASLKDENNKAYTSYYYMYIDNVRFINPVTVSVSSEDEVKGSAMVVGDSIVSAGDSVTIKAIPSDEYIFDAWKQGDQVISMNAEYKFEVFSNTSFVATFKRAQVTVTVDADENGSAYITNYGDSATVDKFTVLTLNAVPNAGYQFLKWNDGVTENPRSFAATENAEYTALFATQSHAILAKVDPNCNDMGTASASGTGPDVNMYYYGTTVTLTATAASGYEFDQWNDGNKDNPRQVTVTANATYTATFKIIKTVVRTLTPGNYYTLCEPQNLTQYEGAIFFEPDTWNGTRLTFVETNDVKAGYGYLILATASELKAVLTGTVLTAAVPDAPNAMQGTLENYQIQNASNDYCGVSQNKLKYFGNNNTVPAKRAYVVLNKVGQTQNNAPASARRISLSFNESNVATALDNFTFDDNQTGAAKYIVNGQLIIVKDGKIMNAQGQEL